jgi:hypothetical protein
MPVVASIADSKYGCVGTAAQTEEYIRISIRPGSGNFLPQAKNI